MKLGDLIYFWIVAITISSCGKQQNVLLRYEVDGNIKTIRSTGYEAIEKFGEVTEGDVLYGDILYEEDIHNLIEFNKEGNITSISYFNNKGDLSKKRLYNYDEDGKVNTINNYDGTGDEIGRTVYTYNDNKKVVKVVDYDKSGKEIYTRTSDWNGDKVIRRQYIKGNTEGGYTLNEYNGNTLVKSVEYDNSSNPTGEYTEYENEKVKKIVTNDFAINLTYNDKGLCSSIENGQRFSINSFWRAKGESYTYDYIYDAKGNWVRKIERIKESQKATRILVREIQYY